MSVYKRPDQETYPSTFKSGAIGFLAIPKPLTKKTPNPSNGA